MPANIMVRFPDARAYRAVCATGRGVIGGNRRPAGILAAISPLGALPTPAHWAVGCLGYRGTARSSHRLARRNLMTKKRSLVCASLFGLWVGISVCPAPAQDINSIGQLIGRGDHAAALLEAQKLEAATKAQFGVNHTSYAYALNALATVYLAQQKYDEAEGLYRRAMAIRAKVLGEDHLEVAHTLTNLS